MSTPFDQIKAITAQLIRIQLPYDDDMSTIYMLATTIVEIDSPVEILVKQQSHREALLTLAAVARSLVVKIENEKTRWAQSDKQFCRT
jgi:hypothetical protein